MAKQVERQRYLLAKEARKEQRRRRRNRSKFRDPFADGDGGNDVVVRQDETCVKISNQPPPLPANHPTKKYSAEFPSGYSSSTSLDTPAPPTQRQQQCPDTTRKRSNEKTNLAQRPSRDIRKRRKIRERAVSAGGGDPNAVVALKDAKKRRKRRTRSQDVKLLQELTVNGEIPKPVVAECGDKVERVQNETSESRKN